MAKPISKTSKAKQIAGLPSREQMLMSPQNTDKLTASIQPPSGGPAQPAALTQGEYVFSIPSIIGMGNGNYQDGLKHVDMIHQKLREHGMKLMGGDQGNSQFDTSNMNGQPTGGIGSS